MTLPRLQPIQSGSANPLRDALDGVSLHTLAVVKWLYHYHCDETAGTVTFFRSLERLEKAIRQEGALPALDSFLTKESAA